MSQIQAEAQKLTTDNLVILYELDLTHVGFGVLRFTSNTTETRNIVRWNGGEYVPWDISVEGFEIATEGSAARPTLSASAQYPELISLLKDAKLQGAEFRRIRTFRKYLDDGEEPDPTVHMPIDIYRVERVTSFKPGRSVTIELANPLDMEQVYFPKRQILKNICYWRYRIWDSYENKFLYSSISPCPYTGSVYLNALNEPTTEINDQCSKTLNACRLRFGTNSLLPFGGFPGAAQPAR